MSRFNQILPLVVPFLIASCTMAATPAPSGLPQVDFSKMGSVGLGGSFAGLDWWSSDSPFSSSDSSSSSTSRFSSDGATVFLRDGDGRYRPLGSTQSGGQVNALCWTDGPDANGTLYIGGSFTSLGGEESANIIAYALSSSMFEPVSPGLSGPVYSLYCDNSRDQVWVGGSFEHPAGGDGGGNVGLWSTASSSWVEVAFGGLNGAVEQITPSYDGDSLFFAGDFSTTFVSNSSTNSTTNITSIPSAPNGTSTTGHSGYLTPVTLPPTSSASGNLTISVGPTTDQEKYSDPNVLLCPGSGTWLAQDNTVANVDLLGYNFWRATGVRVKNAFVQGRATTHFCVTSIPDNLELNMTYTDPKTGKNETCDAWCPLYTDESIEAQDFIFTDGSRNMTGMQMQLKEWQGEGSGLSYVQLLSDGAYGSAATEGNRGICPGRSDRSSVDTVGEWSTSTTRTSIPATVAYYRSTTVSANSGERPQMTFYPYVASTAYYEVYIYIPGCSYTGDCDSRTTVDMEVFPRQNGLGWTSTISQQVQEDTRTLIYSGPIDMTSEAFSPTVILALAADPATVSDDQYTIVASGVELVLTGLVDANGSSISASESGGTNGSTITNTTRSTNSSMRVAYGLFEYAYDLQYNVDAASSRLSNSTETALTQLGFALSAARNASTSEASFAVHAVASLDDIIYAGGNFSAEGNFTNVVSIDSTNNETSTLTGGGLDGIVYAATTVGSYVFFGGDFSSTADGETSLNRLARYDPSGNSWSSLGGGVDGVVTDLIPSSASSSQLVVVGNFSRTLDSDGSSSQSGGYAIWDTSSNAWSDSGVLFGNITSAATASGSDSIYLAGRVYGTSSNPANGIAMLSTEDGVATITSLDGVNFGSAGSFPAPSARKRSVQPSLTRTWLSRFTDVFVERGILVSRATAPTLQYPPAPAPAVLTGGFWRNSSNDNEMITIMGGNFSSETGSGDIGGLAFYADTLSGPSPPVTGVVRAVTVINDNVYVGGSNVDVENVGSNLVVYNLAVQEWQSGNIPTLNPSTGSTVNVNIIKAREDSDTVIVAGNFATAGSLDCSALCLWDTGSAQWTTPGSGLSSGEVRAIDFAGENYETVIVAGAFVLADSLVYVATYNFDNTSWRALDGLPGPALAVASDNKNASSIYAAGYTDDDASTPYLRRWDGSSWTEQNSTLLPGSLVQQLAFVPLASEHDAQGAIEQDRMLMISGDLYLDDMGNVTSALYDGTNWHPYLVGTSSTGTLASGSSLFWSESSFDFSIAHYLARGLVVLVAIAIATGLILLLILIFLLLSYCIRRRERNQRQPETFEKEGSEVSSTHQNVFHSVQTALEQSLVGAGAGAGLAGMGAADANKRHSDPDSFEHVGAGHGSGTDTEDEGAEGESGRETTMRYDFNGPDLQSGELSMRAGQRVVIVDDVQSDEWWFARDPVSGREGVVPATYVW